METEKERLKILDMIDSGQISAQDGIDLLNALSTSNGADSAGAASAQPDSDSVQEPAPEVGPPPVESLEGPEPASLDEPQVEYEPEEPASSFKGEPEVFPSPERFDPDKMKWRSFWWIPMWVGMGILLVGALLMYAAWNASGFGFWFACTWFPFLLGVSVVALAWSSRTARWLHVRVHQKPGQKPEKIAISLPIPLRLTAWFLRMFGNRIPNMEGTSLDEVILALDATSPETPFYVEVNEGDDGERVEVYIG